MWERVELAVLRMALRAADLAVLLLWPRLLCAYLRLWWLELCHSPYRWPRDFASTLARTGSGQSLRELMYGETPVFTAKTLFARAGVKPGSVLVDLGAGRGRALLGARMLGARAIGVELVEEHVRLVSGVLSTVGVDMKVGDAASWDVSEATHIYLTWTGYNQITRDRLVEHLRTTQPGTTIMAIDCPIEANGFRTDGKYDFIYPWGFVPVWIHTHVP